MGGHTMREGLTVGRSLPARRDCASGLDGCQRGFAGGWSFGRCLASSYLLRNVYAATAEFFDEGASGHLGLHTRCSARRLAFCH
jgi:hypothetical protein